MPYNCWEIRNCGCEPDGAHARTLGVCPAALPGPGEGCNCGEYRGRICWEVQGTLCSWFNPDLQEWQEKDLEFCMKCEVFKIIQKEEGADFQIRVVCECRAGAC